MEDTELSTQVENLLMLPYWTSIVNGLVLLVATILLLVSFFLLARHSTAPGVKVTFICVVLLLLQQFFDAAWLFNIEGNDSLATKLFLFSEILFCFLFFLASLSFFRAVRYWVRTKQF